MPWGSVTLKPGVDTQKTLSANEAGVSQSQLIRYNEKMIQTYGGWVNFIPTTQPSTIRDLHAWQDINLNRRLGVGATQNLIVLTAGSQQDITPQTTTTNPTPMFSVSSGSNLVTVVDGSANATIYNTVYFNTPVAIGTLLLSGAYPIQSVTGSTIYIIAATAISCTTVASSGILPEFSISSGSAIVTVDLPNNNYQAIPGLFQQFIAPTQVGSTTDGLVIEGKYQIASVIDSTAFTINSPTQSSTTATSFMNGGMAQLLYYVTLGPTPPGSGFGSGGFGSGGFGSGTATAGTPGTTIVTDDWTQDNWGGVLLACPENGPVYAWDPDSGFQNAQVVSQAPFFNGGLFVAMPQQILVLWRSCQSTGVQDSLLIRWSDQGDYSIWEVSDQTAAGSFHLPTGSIIIGGIQCPQFAMISSDIEIWSMTYVGGDEIFNFTKVGTGCGWISSHACGILAGNPFWMANNNFYTLGAQGVTSIPCSVWDQVFQNLNTNYQDHIRVAVNSAFNEIAWFYPSAASTGENDSYIKVHLEGNEMEWDYGTLQRTAWTDASILGMPIGPDASGQLYQHEMGTTITGAGLPSFRTGWWAISEGQDFPFVDLIIPDFIWGLRSGAKDASVNITFFGVNYPGGPETVYGPYTVNSTTEYINVRIRNRLLSALVQSTNATEFWRLGKIRFRFAASGRR